MYTTWNYCFSPFCPRYSLHVTSLWVFAGWLSFFFSVCVVPSFTYDTCFAIKYASDILVEVCITIYKSSRCKCVFTSCFLAICLKLFQIIFQIANSFYKQLFVFDFVKVLSILCWESYIQWNICYRNTGIQFFTMKL